VRLPMYYELSDTDVDCVAQAVIESLHRR